MRAIKVLYLEGDCDYKIEMESFSAKSCLAWVCEGRPDPENYSILEDTRYGSIHYIMIGENIEGDTYKFITVDA